MFGFICGLIFGTAVTYFVMRFKGALKIFIGKTEKKIEENLTK